jgi:cell division protein FtsQ
VRRLSERLGWGHFAQPALVGAAVGAPPYKVMLRGEQSARAPLRWRLGLDRPAPRKLEVALTVAVLLGAALLGALRGGHLDGFEARCAGLGDFLARKVGLGVEVVTVAGATHMSEPRILAIARIDSTSALPFFNVADARARLEADPQVKQASVRKLYPSQIVIDIVERTPFAVWQKDGEVHAIAADGAPIDEARDGRYVDLPFVVGDGANARAAEFVALLDAMDELKPRVDAGVLVGERRWNLRLKSGVDVKLPETDPQDAIATLLRLERQSRVLERDILAIDLRVKGRAFVRLTQEAATAWADDHAPRKAAEP